MKFKELITEENFDDLDVDYKHLENAFTNKKYYLAMKTLSLQEKQVLYYLAIENYSLKKTSILMNLSQNKVLKLKETAISNFKRNLKKIYKGEN